MIQRPQTLFFLAITAVSLMLMISDTVFYVTENIVTTELCNVEFDETKMIASDGEGKESNTWLFAFTSAVGLLSFLSIFLFKNRKLQILLSSFTYLFILGMIVMMYSYSLGVSYFEGERIESTFTFYALIPIALIALNYFAARGIRRDEMLVRSMDRLR